MAVTEAMPIAAPPTNYRLQREGSVGPAVPSVRIEIVEAEGDTPLGTGAVGEICVSGPTVLPHYEGDTRDQAQVFVSSAPTAHAPAALFSHSTYAVCRCLVGVPHHSLSNFADLSRLLPNG